MRKHRRRKGSRFEVFAKLSGRLCEVGVKCEVAVEFSACRCGQIKFIPVTLFADFRFD